MKDNKPIKHIHLFKNYTAQYDKNDFVLFSETGNEIGKVADESNFFRIRHYIEYQSRTYYIKNIGFLKNDIELSLSKRVIYFTDLAKDRIIKSGEDVRIYYFTLTKTNQLFEKGKLLIKIQEVKHKSKETVFYIEADESVEDLLILLFLHYSTKEFNSIGGDGD
ncbi:hypothetical protein AB670_04070 [Chryseobacterium sp. MOF25P]|uniref:hypothetical protein n=1 Tax=unclassified Chryseobacterium TaxID=2593645 RepID=UPI0008049D17|nr:MULTISPECIES: hypothetical protein [unclassified Chryseobacterium]OBW39586.1 hypothetical protein AB670_04070 [Chryseobacterium sp. MOF25P]OBW45417.1 hypothetical protein AB671_02483 [Chryseobacterium sp. BGARF1]